MINNNILANISSALLANIVTTVVSIVVIFFLPKYVEVLEYGMWQLYVLYISFIGFFHFGWIDGIYLRYSGISIEFWNKKLFFCQVIAFVIFEVIVSLLGLVLACIFFKNTEMYILINFVCVVIPAYNLYWLSLYILQITNRIKDYAKLMIIERSLFVIMMLFAIYFNFIGFENLLLMNTISIYVATIYGVLLIRNTFLLGSIDFAELYREVCININVGSKLLLANFVGILVVGIFRLGISYNWGIETFGKVSLALSILHFMMILVNALSVVFFPIFKSMSLFMLRTNYSQLRIITSVIFLGGLLLHYPITNMLNWWLPKYYESYSYLLFLFPMMLYEGVLMLLTNNYLKTLRKESIIFKVSLMSLIISSVLMLISIFGLNDLKAAIYSILLLNVFKCIISEYCLEKELNINLKKIIFLESSMIMLFTVLCSGIVLYEYGLLVFFLFYLIYIYNYRCVLSNKEGIIYRWYDIK